MTIRTLYRLVQRLHASPERCYGNTSDRRRSRVQRGAGIPVDGRAGKTMAANVTMNGSAIAAMNGCPK
jgi:hypothetical protein